MSEDNEERQSTVLGTAGVFNLLKDRVHPWKSVDGDPFVDVWKDGRRSSIPVDSRQFNAWVYCELSTLRPEKIPSKTAIDHFTDWVAGQALMKGVTREAYYRIAALPNEIIYEPMREDGKLVRVSGGKWELVNPVPETPRFIHAPGMQPQPSPAQTGKKLVDMLAPFIPTKTRADLELLAAWLVGCFKPGGPFPVLIINGEQGSAKSTTTRVLRKLVDPHSRDMCEPPTNNRDFVAVVKNGYVLAVDNLSTLPAWLSDQLCRLATGTGAIGGRALYTNADLASFTACRPVILNGIPSFVEREDLSDRSIHLVLPEIPPNKRKDDDTFWAEFNAALPEIQGALFNAVAQAQAGWADVKLAELPRMANFARWAVAGCGTAFLEAYNANRKVATEYFVEHNDVAQAIIGMLMDKKEYRGTLVALLNDLVTYAPSRGKYWPENTLQLKNRLTRIKPELRKIGVEIYDGGREAGTGRSRIEIRRAQDFQNRGYAVSAT